MLLVCYSCPHKTTTRVMCKGQEPPATSWVCDPTKDCPTNSLLIIYIISVELWGGGGERCSVNIAHHYGPYLNKVCFLFYIFTVLHQYVVFKWRGKHAFLECQIWMCQILTVQMLLLLFFVSHLLCTIDILNIFITLYYCY